VREALLGLWRPVGDFACVVGRINVGRLKSGNGQQLGVAQAAVDVQDEGKFLAEFAHPEEIFQTHASAECGRLFDVLGSEVDDLVHGIGDHAHHSALGVLLDFNDDDAGRLAYRTLLETEAHREIDNGNDVAAQVDDATNPLGHFGDLSDRGVLDDFFYALN